MHLLYELLCLFLVAVGLLVVFLYVRTRYDRMFLQSGVTILLLAGAAGVDIWAIPAQTSIDGVLYWTRIQHVLGCGILVFLAWYLPLLSGGTVPPALRILVGATWLVASLSMTPAMLYVSAERITTTLLYAVVWGGYAVAMASYLLWYLVRAARSSPRPDSRIAQFHLVGFVAMFAFGVADLVVMTTIGPGKLGVPNFTLLGVLLLGVMISLVFAERFLQLVQDRAQAYEKLHAAVREMEAAAGVRQLGEVSAMIGHELRNDLQVVHSSMELLEMQKAISPAGQRTLGRMRERLAKSMQFTEDMLDLVRSRMLREKAALDLRAVIQRSIETYHATRAEAFVWEEGDAASTVQGDWGKLEHVFGNLFRNSFEADAHRIRIRFSQGSGVLVVALEDDGKGCDDPAIVEKFFTAFNTTKGNKLGTGLGMAVTRAIVEAHGGCISAYSKNLMRRGEHGLCVEVALPITEAEPVYGEVALVKEGIADLEPVLRVLRNVHVAPRICAKPLELLEPGANSRLVLIGADRSRDIGRLDGRIRGEVLLLATENATTYAMHLAGDTSPQLFTEELVVRCLMAA